MCTRVALFNNTSDYLEKRKRKKGMEGALSSGNHRRPKNW
jgi:hypothetical protein